VTQTQTTLRKGWHSSEFWFSVFVSASSIIGALAHFLPPNYAALAVAISGAAYTISRGLSKQNTAQGASGTIDMNTVQAIAIALANQYVATKQQDVATVLQGTSNAPTMPVVPTAAVSTANPNATADNE